MGRQYSIHQYGGVFIMGSFDTSFSLNRRTKYNGITISYNHNRGRTNYCTLEFQVPTI